MTETAEDIGGGIVKRDGTDAGGAVTYPNTDFIAIFFCGFEGKSSE